MYLGVSAPAKRPRDINGKIGDNSKNRKSKIRKSKRLGLESKLRGSRLGSQNLS